MGSDLLDASQSSTIVNGGTTVVAGSVGYARNFDGIGNFMTPSLSAVEAGNEISIMILVRGDETKLPGTTTIFEARNGTSSNSRNLNIHLPWSSTMYFDAGTTLTSYNRMSKGASESEYEGQYRNWTFTKNAISGDIKIYLDGILWSSDTGKTAPLLASNYIKIGVDTNGDNLPSSTDDFYPGIIDEIRITNLERNAAWIKAENESLFGNLVTINNNY